jgi:hypothetical protein
VLGDPPVSVPCVQMPTGDAQTAGATAVKSPLKLLQPSRPGARLAGKVTMHSAASGIDLLIGLPLASARDGAASVLPETRRAAQQVLDWLRARPLR